MKNGIAIGAESETVRTFASEIRRILDSDADQATIQKALDVLQSGTRVENVTVRDCQIQSGPDPKSLDRFIREFRAVARELFS